MAASSTLSETLKSITITKIKELEKQRSSYNTRWQDILAAADEQGPDVSGGKLAKLYNGVKQMPKTPGSLTELNSVARWLAQARYDPTVPNAKLESTLR